MSVETLSARFKVPEDFIRRYMAAMASDGTVNRVLHKELMALIPSAVIAHRFMEEIEDEKLRR